MQYLKRVKDNWKKENPFRSRFIFFEGLDKTGKTTLCRRVRFEGGHTCLFFDRGFVGRKVFMTFHKERNFPIWDWSFLERKLIDEDALAIVRTGASLVDIRYRHIEVGELPLTDKVMLEQQRLYDKFILDLPLKVPCLTLNTSLLDENTCVKRILEWAEII